MLCENYQCAEVLIERVCFAVCGLKQEILMRVSDK